MEDLKINSALLKAIMPDVADELITKAVASINNYVQGNAETLISKEKGKVKGETLQLIDDAAKEIGGERSDGEKSTDFIKRIVFELKSKEKKATDRATELETKLKDGAGDAAIKEQLRSVTEQNALLVKENSTIKKTTAEEIAKIKDENEAAYIEMQLRASAPKLKAGIITAEQEKILVDLAIKEHLGSTKRVDGKLIFTDKDGKILRNEANNHEPYTATELLSRSKILENLLETERKAEGIGHKPDPTVQTTSKVDISKYTNAKSKDELTEMLNKDFKEKTPDYYATYKEATTALKLT
jgi:hypothetical protein